MTIAWVIGLILSFLGILLFKNSRIKATEQIWDIPEEPILKVWSILLLILGGLLPVFNIFMGLAMIIWWAVSVYSEGDWVCKEDSLENRIAQLLNKPIK